MNFFIFHNPFNSYYFIKSMVVKFLSADKAKILSNKTARKILETLEEKKSTSQIAKELNLPLTTVDYNISQLQKAGLIKSGYYKWSKRGNKMKLYEQAGEILIFAPEDKQQDILKALNKFTVPVILGISALFGFLVQKLFYGTTIAQSFTQEAIMSGADKSFQSPASAPVAETAVNIAQSEPQLWFWFILVAGLVLGIIYLIKLYKK